MTQRSMAAVAARTLGAVLAGGESRRMGEDKASVEWEGVSLLERAAGELSRVFAEVVVSGDARRHAGRGFHVLADRRAGVGPLAGLETALEYAAPRAVFVLACDLVRVPARLIEHVTELASGELAAAPSIGGSLQPLCGFYLQACREPLSAFLDAGGRRAVDFFGHVGGREIVLGPDLDFFAPDLLLNVNRPSDLTEHRPEETGAGA